jgi:hypothetical protein
MLLSQAGGRPAHLTRVRDALIALPEPEQGRLGVTENRKTGPHLLTYRQTERTFGLIAAALGGNHPGGLPSARLQRICDDLLEASIPGQLTGASRSLAVDWTDLESFSPPRRTAPATAPTPRPPGDTARTTCCAAKTSCSSATTCPPRS